ncbi:MAG: hypothetical protein AB9873_14105 [Syntrophobacteraceae bacterium]
MYLRRIQTGHAHHYVLRESFFHEECWHHRDLLDVGHDPGSYIVYPGGNGFYFDFAFQERLEATGADYSEEQLEEAFFSFLPQHIQRLLRQFSRRGPSRDTGTSREFHQEQMRKVHSFDKRRLHYLRFGRLDMGNLESRPLKFLNVLMNKSRDEIEHTIESMEVVLRPHETRNYLYAALNLELYFSGSLLKHHPLALDPEKVDQVFLDEVCALNQDSLFFFGVDDRPSGTLHDYLKRYVILYFDAPPAARMDFADFGQFFRNRRGGAYSVSSPTRTSTKEALARFEITQEEFKQLNEEELRKIYRRKAKDAHPDRGGRHDEFLDLTEAYETLLRSL